METIIINQLIASRSLAKEEDYDIFEKIEEEMYHEKKNHDLATYFHGFEDVVFGDSSIFNYFEYVFLYTVEITHFTEEYIINQLILNVNIFLPHAPKWYSAIINFLLYHYKNHPYDIMIRDLAKLKNDERKRIGDVLKISKREAFIYDDAGDVFKQYQSIIDFCLS